MTPLGPGSAGGGQRQGFDRRWLLIAAVAVVAVIILVATGRVHVTEFSLLVFLAFVPSVILHEVSHGWVALSFGDDTAKRARRLTLNPLAHIDIFGTIVMPVVLALAHLPVFGYAKPVPVNPARMRRPRNQWVVTALAGPAVNIVLAVSAGVGFHALSLSSREAVGVYISGFSGPPVPWPALLLFCVGWVNVILAVFNLIPVPPLDGSAVIERFIPSRWLPRYLELRPFGILVLLVLIMIRSGAILSDVFTPFLSAWQHLLGWPFS